MSEPMADEPGSNDGRENAPVEQKFLFLGNQLWLDFLNTLIKQNGERIDLLGDFADFVRWLRETEALDEDEAQEALRRWPSPSEQAHILEEARSFRAILHTAVESVTRSEAVAGAVVDAINGVLRRHCRSLRLDYDGSKLTRQYVGEITEPIHLFAPVAESAAVALTGDDLSLTRKCENPICVLHFHDMSKNHARRWCSMETCGNRIKAATHYKRGRVKREEQDKER